MRGKEKQKRVEKRVRHMQKNIPLDFLDCHLFRKKSNSKILLFLLVTQLLRVHCLTRPGPVLS